MHQQSIPRSRKIKWKKRKEKKWKKKKKKNAKTIVNIATKVKQTCTNEKKINFKLKFFALHFFFCLVPARHLHMNATGVAAAGTSQSVRFVSHRNSFFKMSRMPGPITSTHTHTANSAPFWIQHVFAHLNGTLLCDIQLHRIRCGMSARREIPYQKYHINNKWVKMSNIICVAIHSVCISIFFYWFRQRQTSPLLSPPPPPPSPAEAIKPTTVSKMLIEIWASRVCEHTHTPLQ